MYNLEKVTFFAGKNMGFPRFFSKSFLQNCKKITTKEMADTNHGPVNYESCGSCALIRKGPSAM
jgi:hypothetical protein